jgi:hypothetical protein
LWQVTYSYELEVTDLIAARALKSRLGLGKTPRFRNPSSYLMIVYLAYAASLYSSIFQVVCTYNYDVVSSQNFKLAYPFRPDTLLAKIELSVEFYE